MMDLSPDPADLYASVDDVPWSPPSETKSTKRKALNISQPPLHAPTAYDVIVDDARDALLTPFGRATLKDRYQTEGETPQDRFANSVRFYADDAAHAQRMYDYVSQQWCIGATPITSNGGTRKGNLISCFVNEMGDNLESIIDTWKENAWIGAKGGGIGTYISNVRSIGEPIARNGKTSGAISMAQVINAVVGTVNQGSNRRGAGATYMHISHPEIDAFLDMRRQAGGDADRKCMNLHHGVVIPDAFMEAVENNGTWDLVSPHSGKIVETVMAQDLMIKILTTRLETGEPYILFEDNYKKFVPEHHKRSGLYPKTSNLCSEILLPTGLDHHNRVRTAVCCLFQINLEKWNEWKDHPTFYLDICRFLDNVLQDFIDHGGEEFVNARYSASQERSIGIGVMGFHSFLQSMGIAYESVMAKVWNMKFFTHHKEKLDEASRILAEERGACPDAAEHGIMERFSYKSAIAPTASVSIICGGVSAGIDIIPANIYTGKTLDGNFEVRNPHLEKVLEGYGKNNRAVWKSILEHKGSVQHLEFLTEDEREVYKTSFEVDMRYHVELAADRTPYIDQSQSLNIALLATCHKRDLWKIHQLMWRKGVKSAYYVRSLSVSDVNSTTVAKEEVDYESCLSCQ